MEIHFLLKGKFLHFPLDRFPNRIALKWENWDQMLVQIQPTFTARNCTEEREIQDKWMIIFPSPPGRKKKIAVTVVIIIKQKRTCYELLWLKCKEGGCVPVTFQNSVSSRMRCFKWDFIMEHFSPFYASEMQLWILSIHCWALCASWAQKLYTRLFVFSCKAKTRTQRCQPIEKKTWKL